MAYLQIKEGEGGRRVDLPDSGEIVLGRLPTSDIPLNHGSVSGRHCVLSKDGARFRIKDLGSTNGTRVNGEAVAESPVHRGDVITLGDVEVVLQGDDVAEAPRGASATEQPESKVAASVVAASAPDPTASSELRIAPLASASAPSTKLPEAFKPKRSSNRIWGVAIFFACVLAAVLVAMLFRLMAGAD